MKNQKAIRDEYKFRKKPKRETLLEKEKREKRETAEEDYVLSQVGQRNEKKGRKLTVEDWEKTEAAEKRLFANELDWLTSKRRFRDEEYLISLASILWHKLKDLDWPLGYHFKVLIEGKKILSEFRDNYYRRFVRGIKATGTPKYDYKAVQVLAASAQETVDDLQTNPEAKKSKGGIYLP